MIVSYLRVKYLFLYMSILYILMPFLYCGSVSKYHCIALLWLLYFPFHLDQHTWIVIKVH